MATKTFEELKQLAIQIRDEKTNKQNTATRVGTEMLEHLNKLEQDYYDKTTINNRTSEYNVSINHPTSGISSSNKYDLSSAIVQVPAELRSSGLTVSFLNSDGDTEKWEFGGGSWAAGSFEQVGAGKLTELENNVGLYNVDKNVPLGSGFYTSTTARAAVPSTVRKLGLIITYKTDAATSVTEQFTGSDISAWSTEANWSKIGGNKTTNISDDINKIQLAEILDKTTNEGYRISSTGTETKDSAYNHVSFNALPTDVIIFRGSKTANVYTDFFVIEKTDGTFESLKVNSQYNNPISVIEVSLSSYSDIKKVHYNDYASNPIEIYKISDGLAYYTLSQKLKDTFANRTNYYQSIVNVLNPEDSEARKDGYYDYSNKFSSNASYQAITIPASFGNTYFAVRGDNGKLLSIGSNSYPILYLDSNKEIVQVKKNRNGRQNFCR